ncbi:MAG: 50S ribosomal protein L19 [Patescibacteria group bacterium]
MMPMVQKIKFSPVDIDARAKLDFNSGDTIRVWQRIKEGDKSRLQAFEGLVIARKHGREPGATFTMRKVSGGIGVERIFPLYSPTIEKIEIVSHSKVRRAKLYYIRDKAAKEIRKKMKQLIRVEKVVLVPSKAEGIEKAPEKVENKAE